MGTPGRRNESLDVERKSRTERKLFRQRTFLKRKADPQSRPRQRPAATTAACPYGCSGGSALHPEAHDRVQVHLEWGHLPVEGARPVATGAASWEGLSLESGCLRVQL
ncbi:hypothetical protein HZH66_015326 [Vespula vulgaris]|uniref:Uncharacterized protein n=1 Tax=Vespula vulgaris TaxID=7454 RepID=A0A834J1S4_VESVU|nr:hypothetical protein HZH66_015326 [Vespula vulgaris]